MPGEQGHLKRGHVPQHNVANPLVVAFDVSIRAPLPEEAQHLQHQNVVLTLFILETNSILIFKKSDH